MSCKYCENDYCGVVCYLPLESGDADYLPQNYCQNCGKLLAELEPLSLKPLTLEQLGNMTDKEWVWLAFPELPPEESGWGKPLRTYQIYSHENYGKTWLAYTHEPKESHPL